MERHDARQVTVGPEHAPALTQASKAVRASDLHPIHGVYATIDRAGAVAWVGLNHWRLIAATIGAWPAGPLWTHRIDHRRWVDSETGEKHPSELADLQAFLKEGETVTLEPRQEPPASTLQELLALTQTTSGTTVTLPGARAPEWKDADGRKLDYELCRTPLGEQVVFDADHVIPFKGRTLHKLTDHVWGFVETKKNLTVGGLLAEAIRPLPEPEAIAPAVASAWER